MAIRGEWKGEEEPCVKDWNDGGRREERESQRQAETRGIDAMTRYETEEGDPKGRSERDRSENKSISSNSHPKNNDNNKKYEYAQVFIKR